MEQIFHKENRETLYQSIEKDSLVVVFSGHAPRKTADENYPYFANRNFVYLTGVEQENTILLAKVSGTEVMETLFLLPPDLLAERWNGARIKPDDAQASSGVAQIAWLESFYQVFDKMALSGEIQNVYMDFDKAHAKEPDSPAYEIASYIKERFPFLKLHNLLPLLKRQRTFKKPCEIEAMRKAALITKEGIQAMMRASKPGMYEYQYKAEFDYTLAQHGVLSPAFPSIISAGSNNFCIHYYSYRGQAQDGDMILNDVGACWDNEVNDVSRGWPCNGKFSDKQRLLYECAYRTSEYMFSRIKPGMPMNSVDQIARKYNFEQLKEIGLCQNYQEVGKYIWHGGAHHIGYDVHDVVDMTHPVAPGMVFCVDVGIYCEEWGIGFRVEDNCLVTENGCENLTAAIPKKLEDIEAFMGK